MSETADFARGRRLLRQLLPSARVEARKEDGKIELKSALGRETAAYVREDNLDALLIYPAPLGGWHADVVFKHVPPGVPNSMGSPVEHPLRTRQEAEDFAKRLLANLLRIAQMEKSSGNPVFLLHGAAFTLPPEMYKLALGAVPEGAGGPNGGYSSKEHAINRIEETLADLCPAGFDVKAFNDEWDRGKKAELMTVLFIATLTGVYAYPPRRDATPSGHREQSTARH